MPAPIVVPLAENMSTFTNFAEKANNVSENKYKLEVSKIAVKQNEKLTKMTKEMNDLKYELSQMKTTKGQKRNVKRDTVKEAGRDSPMAKTVRRNSIQSTDDEENAEPTRKTKSGTLKAERTENERINNLQRRYTCKLGSDVTLKLGKGLQTGTRKS